MRFTGGYLATATEVTTAAKQNPETVIPTAFADFLKWLPKNG